MSPSGAELLRQIKSQIEEVDPSEVKELIHEGVAIIDVRETDEFATGHLPGAKHVPRSYLESRIEGVVPDRSTPGDPLLRLRQPLRLRARTLEQDLGYEHVRSMTGGITLWKDRGYDVDVPRSADRRAARPLLAPPAGPRDRRRGPAEAARREGAAARRRRPRLADRAVPRGGRRRHAGNRRRRRRRSLQPAAPGDPHDRSVGTPKVDSAEESIRALNPDVKVVKYPARIDASNIMEIIEGYDVIVDGVDNFPTRYLLNDATVRLQIPVVSASILGFDGQLSVFKPYEGPCYRCLFREPPPAELAPSCGANGVLGVLPGTMGLLQATEVVKLILGIGEPAIGRLLLYDALGATLTEVKVHRDPECPICSRDPDEIADEELGVFPDYEAFCAAAG